MSDERFNVADEGTDVSVYTADVDGDRLDKFVAEKMGVSRSQAQRLIEEQSVSVNGKLPTKNYKIKSGDSVEVQIPENEECDAQPEDIPLDVVFEDDDIIVVNKPKGMVVHPAPGHSSGTLVNALMFHCGDSLSGIGGVNRPGIVHRIDRDTTGLICAAKNDFSHLALSQQLKDHSMYREYRLIVCGNMREDSGTVNAPIGRHPVDRKKMAVIRDGRGHARDAVTHWRVLERYNGFCYVEAVLETGRTHQIRVHMSYIGHQLVGDTTYGGGRTQFERHSASLIDGQMLHATALNFKHPRTGETMRFETPLPENFTLALEKLRRMSE